MKAAMKWLKTFFSEEEAPTMVEYGLLMIVIALTVVVGASIFGTALSEIFTVLGTFFSGVDTTVP